MNLIPLADVPRGSIVHKAAPCGTCHARGFQTMGCPHCMGTGVLPGLRAYVRGELDRAQGRVALIPVNAPTLPVYVEQGLAVFADMGRGS